MCSDSGAGSYLRLIQFVHHSTLGLSAKKKKKKEDQRNAKFRELQVWGSGKRKKRVAIQGLRFRFNCSDFNAAQRQGDAHTLAPQLLVWGVLQPHSYT
jgi:hypothetical protein